MGFYMNIFCQHLAQVLECLSACWREPVCYWCDSHHQRRLSTPCRDVGVWSAYPSHTSSVKAPPGECSRKHTTGWAWNLAGSTFSACSSSLLCVMGVPALAHLLSTGFHISGSLPEHISMCCIQGLGPEQFHGTCQCPHWAAPPGTSCAAWQHWSAAKKKSRVAWLGKWVITGKALKSTLTILQFWTFCALY